MGTYTSELITGFLGNFCEFKILPYFPLLHIHFVDTKIQKHKTHLGFSFIVS